MTKRKAPKSWAEQLADLDDPTPKGTEKCKEAAKEAKFPRF